MALPAVLAASPVEATLLAPDPLLEAGSAKTCRSLLTRQCFGQLLIAITRIWAPTRIVLTADTASELERLVRRNRMGEVVGVKLPSRAVFMASHSCYLDWVSRQAFRLRLTDRSSTCGTCSTSRAYPAGWSCA